jgi:hypothetical protein
MFLAARPAIPAGLLVLAASLVGATHASPTGPLGAACFLAAAGYLELAPGREPQPEVRSAG